MNPAVDGAGFLKTGRNLTTKIKKAVREHSLCCIEFLFAAASIAVNYHDKPVSTTGLVLASLQSRHRNWVHTILVGL